MPYHHTFYTARQIAELLGISVQKAAKLPLDWEVIDARRSCNILNLFSFVKSQQVNP